MEKQITKKSTARQNRTFRLSEYELRKLSEDAKAAGMNESKYLRSFYRKEILFTALKEISAGRRSVATIGMIGGFLDGETDNKKEYGKAEPDFPTIGI